MSDKSKKSVLAILKILLEDGHPHSSQEITAAPCRSRHELSERTARLPSPGTNADGLTENLGKQGRRITELGQRELSSARAFEKVGYLAAKIDQLTYTMDFDLARREGKVVVNVSLLEREQLAEAIPRMARVFAAKLGVRSVGGAFRSGRTSRRRRRSRGEGQASAPSARSPSMACCCVTVSRLPRVSAASRIAGASPDAFRRINPLRGDDARTARGLHPQWHDRLQWRGFDR